MASGNRAPKLVSDTHYCVMGDVTVANSAVIAPGVVLQASPGSRIVVADGACLAGGVCIQARQGVLTIGAGANLGANVLIVGNGIVGENACISPGSTLMNPQVSASSLIPPGSLVTTENSTASSQQSGFSQNGSSQNEFSQNGFSQNGSSQNGLNQNGFSQNGQTQNGAIATDDTYRNTFVEPPPIGPKPIETPSLSDQNGQYVDPSAQKDGVQSIGAINNGSHNNESALSVRSNDRVYGKDQVSQLLSTLFPHRQT